MLAVAALIAVPIAEAGLRVNSPDAATLQLWHFDEAAGATSVANAAPGGYPLGSVAAGATLGNTAYAGFGNALRTFDSGPLATLTANPNGVPGRDAYAAPVSVVTGTADNIPLAHRGADGAFTIEAMVYVDFNPASLAVAPDTQRQMMIVGADAEESGTGGGANGRLFQFRLNWTTANDTTPSLEFINIGSPIQSLVANLPVTGPNAIAQGNWYHTAVTYDGAANTANNLKLYWTKVDPARDQAALLAAFTMTNDLPDVVPDWTIGNDGRNAVDSNWVGLIDEVRFSSIARAATDFIFTTDTDADGLDDGWEMKFFGTLARNGAGDPDGDGYANAQEFAAGSFPNNHDSVPAAPIARFVPVDDGDPATSEYGYAGSSGINTISSIASALSTVGNYQFLACYGRHATDAAYGYNNKLVIARRRLNAPLWEVFRTNFTPNNIADGHDTISMGFDGEGYLHLSWGMHADAFHYAKTTTPVTDGQPVVFGPDGTMTGNENTVTYPQFFTLPDGDLLYLFREGGSGAGDTYLNRYRVATHAWSNVHTSAGAQVPFIKGRGWSPDYNAYPNIPCLDAAGNLFLVWTWRYNTGSPAGETGYQTNHDFAFAMSVDAGATWQRQNGSAYTLPISQSAESGVENTRAERVLTIPEGHSLINSAGMCLDRSGQPVIATWWAPGTAVGNYRRQYMVAFPTPAGWQTRQVSNRTNNPTTTKYPEADVRDLGRPIVATDAADRIIVIYRDDDGANGLTVAHSLPRAEDPDRLVWITFDLTTDNLGNYESVFDRERWARDGVMHLLVQASEGHGYAAPANTASPVGVVEWDAASYFASQPALHFARLNGGADTALEWQSKPGCRYRLFTSTDLTGWTELAAFAGTGGLLGHTHADGGGQRRFWRLEVTEGGAP